MRRCGMPYWNELCAVQLKDVARWLPPNEKARKLDAKKNIIKWRNEGDAVKTEESEDRRTKGKSHSPTNGREEQVHSDADSMEEEADFNWEEYLEETGATAAPHTAFKHVDISLQSSFQPGMKLEVANKSSPDTYWVATIVTTCGQLLLLRFSGYGDDRKADFWCDVMTAELHPVGWCSQNNKTLQPPEDNVYLRKAIKEKYSDWTDFLIQDLTGSRTAPANLLEGLHGNMVKQHCKQH
ncbi:hypothetical protein J4Q44_G00143850 [Coregonus suidteri]|uniref:Scm-like with four MBT domains protein 2 n=1 Tax=Coregonus suidteri TaxID=861788 RepID=A0AAN8QX19_9TELE